MAHVAEDSKALAEDILSSARGRQQAMADTKSDVADLAAATQGFLRDCHAKMLVLGSDVQRAAEELRQQLANGDTARVKVFGEMHRRIADRMTGIAQEVKGMLEDTRNDVLGTRAVWSDLASARSDLTKTPKDKMRKRPRHSS